MKITVTVIIEDLEATKSGSPPCGYDGGIRVVTFKTLIETIKKLSQEASDQVLSEYMGDPPLTWGV